jgi:anthranilate synthase component II
MKQRILIIDNYDSFTYNLIQIIAETGTYECVMMKNDEIDFIAADRFENMLISPGPGVPSEAGDLIKFIVHFAPKKKILGVCLGHQAIAEVFGGSLVQLPTVVHGMKKRIRIHKPKDYLFNQLPEHFEVGLYHSWAVSGKNLPECLRVTASTTDGTIMALRHNEFDVRGVQFHPESFMTDYGRIMIQNWLRH